MKQYTIQTHADIDTNGKVFGIETKHFIPILCALFASIILFFLVSINTSGNELSFLTKAAISFSPIILTIIYVFTFFIGKVPHFQEDFFETLLYGSNFNVHRIDLRENPLIRKYDE